MEKPFFKSSSNAYFRKLEIQTGSKKTAAAAVHRNNYFLIPKKDELDNFKVVAVMTNTTMHVKTDAA